MEEVEQKKLERILRGKYLGLSDSLVSTAITIYREIEKYHERRVRLTAEQFEVAQRDFDLLWGCVIYLVAVEFAAKDGNAPLLIGMRPVPELGGKRGWVRLAIKLPSKPPPKGV